MRKCSENRRKETENEFLFIVNNTVISQFLVFFRSRPSVEILCCAFNTVVSTKHLQQQVYDYFAKTV